MTARKGLPIQVVVADAGPLISLAACDRLDLLGAFDRPVRVADVVRAGCLRHPGKIGTATLAQWFADPGCPAQVVATPLLVAWEGALANEAADPGNRDSVGIGDAATAWLLRQAQFGFLLDGPVLVLTEDGPFGDGVIRDRFPEVHVLSTRALLRTLENFGVIALRKRSSRRSRRPGDPWPATWPIVRAVFRPSLGRVGPVSSGPRKTTAPTNGSTYSAARASAPGTTGGFGAAFRRRSSSSAACCWPRRIACCTPGPYCGAPLGSSTP